MPINLNDLEFGGELQKDTVYNLRVTYVRAVETKKHDKLRLSVGADVINGPCTGERVWFAGFDFKVIDYNEVDAAPTLIKLLKDIAKITGKDPQKLKDLKAPGGEDEETSLMDALLGACFQATLTYNPPRGDYDASWQVSTRDVLGPIPDDVPIGNPMAALLEE
jgi:hypothetical protein